MRTNLAVVLMILLIFSKTHLTAQTNDITMNGSIDTALTNAYACYNLTIKLKESTNSFSQGTSLTIPIKNDGTFKAKIKAPTPIIYLSFELLNNGKLYNPGVMYNVGFPKRHSALAYLSEVYLFETGDSIYVSIGKDGSLLFTGKGNEKLNCQYQIYTIDANPKGTNERESQLISTLSFEKGLHFGDKVMDLSKKLKLAILDSYKSDLTEKNYEILYLDILGAVEYPKQNSLFLLSSKYAKKGSVPVVQKYLEDQKKKNQVTAVDSTYMSESAYYPELLFEQEFNRIRLYSKNASYKIGDSFNDIYQQIKNKYRGILRDKLLLICFEKLNLYYSDQARSCITDALDVMTDERHKQSLKSWADEKYAAYPFELEDAKGKSHKLSDYHGKILVIDFWYTGCKWCMILNKAMAPIIEKYKNNQQIVFLTVSIDKQKDTWLKSVVTGNYTSPETINLYTNGLGQNHPMIQNYNFTGYPQQLIIDQNGTLITASPPRVSGTANGKVIDENTNKEDAAITSKAFIKILDDCLAAY